MDGAKVAVDCLCSVLSCVTCWFPNNELADAHRGECKYCKMIEVMEQLNAASDQLLDEDGEMVGNVKEAKEVENGLQHKLLPNNACAVISEFPDIGDSDIGVGLL